VLGKLSKLERNKETWRSSPSIKFQKTKEAKGMTNGRRAKADAENTREKPKKTTSLSENRNQKLETGTEKGKEIL
jgi:hypothetical protein